MCPETSVSGNFCVRKPLRPNPDQAGFGGAVENLRGLGKGHTAATSTYGDYTAERWGPAKSFLGPGSTGLAR